MKYIECVESAYYKIIIIFLICHRTYHLKNEGHRPTYSDCFRETQLQILFHQNNEIILVLKYITCLHLVCFAARLFHN